MRSVKALSLRLVTILASTKMGAHEAFASFLSAISVSLTISASTASSPLLRALRQLSDALVLETQHLRYRVQRQYDGREHNREAHEGECLQPRAERLHRLEVVQQVGAGTRTVNRRDRVVVDVTGGERDDHGGVSASTLRPDFSWTSPP